MKTLTLFLTAVLITVLVTPFFIIYSIVTPIVFGAGEMMKEISEELKIK